MTLPPYDPAYDPAQPPPPPVIDYASPDDAMYADDMFDRDMAGQIMLNADFRDIFNLCQSSKRFSRVCEHDNFWRLRYLKDYRNDAPTDLPTGNWKEAYYRRHQGKLYMFGANNKGQLGTGDLDDRRSPTHVGWLTDVVQFSCGHAHTGVVTGDGSLYMFGDNSKGQLGLGLNPQYTNHVAIPTRVRSLGHVVKVSCGNSYTGAVTRDGTLWMCGHNSFGQLGTGLAIGGTVDIFEEVPSLTNVVDVSCGLDHTGVITADGKLYMIGSNEDGKLGNNSRAEMYAYPVEIKSLINVAKVSCGYNHTAVLTKDGQLYTFGNNYKGQLGTHPSRVSGFKSIVPAKVEVNAFTYVVDVSCGDEYTGVITADGRLFMFGLNTYNRFGMNEGRTNAQRAASAGVRGRVYHQPSAVERLRNNAVRVSCSEYNTGVIDKYGHVHMFGDDTNGELVEDALLYEARMISCGQRHTGVIARVQQ